MLIKSKQLKKISASAVLAGALMLTFPAWSEASIGDKLLQQGAEHEDVGKLHERLHERGYLEQEEKLESDTYTQVTAEAVETFQIEHQLLVDGIAGTQTIGALSVLQQGDEGQAVEDLQQDLNTLGYYQYHIDGIFGPITHQAVKDFQTDFGIQIDGLAGPETYGTLHKAMRERESQEPASESVQEESSSTEEAESPQEESSSTEENEATQDEQPGKSESAQEESSSTEEAESTQQETSSNETAANDNDKKRSATTASTDDQSNDSVAASDEVREFEAEATAYTANCDGCTGVTHTGIDLRANPDQKVIAVDPDVIPLGSTVEVEGYGTAVAADVGSSIQGEKIDVFLPDHSEAVEWGRQNVTVRVIDEN